MDVAPLVSAYRARYAALDAYGDQVRGLARPAPTIEEALRKAAVDLRGAKDPQAAIFTLASVNFAETRQALRDVIARWENNIAIAISKIAREEPGPHVDLRARLDGLDRSYRSQEPEPNDFKGWQALIAAQREHLKSLAALGRDVEKATLAAAQANAASPRRLRLFLGIIVLGALAAFGFAVFTSIEVMRDASQAAPSPSQPRVVRTVPIIAAAPPTETAAAPCRALELEVTADGADLLDSTIGGRAILRLPAGEKVHLRRVIQLESRRMMEVEAPGRPARGFVSEQSVRIPAIEWTCDR